MLFGVGLVAFSTLLPEVDITRVFAVTLWYDFGFLAISRALPGAIVVLIGVVATTVYHLFIHWMWRALPYRVAVSLLLPTPIGLLPGMCFPLGIRWAQLAHEHLVPWAWAVNDVFSLFAAAALPS